MAEVSRFTAYLCHAWHDLCQPHVRVSMLLEHTDCRARLTPSKTAPLPLHSFHDSSWRSHGKGVPARPAAASARVAVLKVSWWTGWDATSLLLGLLLAPILLVLKLLSPRAGLRLYMLHDSLQKLARFAQVAGHPLS